MTKYEEIPGDYFGESDSTCGLDRLPILASSDLDLIFFVHAPKLLSLPRPVNKIFKLFSLVHFPQSFACTLVIDGHKKSAPITRSGLASVTTTKPTITGFSSDLTGDPLWFFP